MDTDTGPADYMLFIDGKACGIIEAKREGANLSKVAEQFARYATSKTRDIQRWVPEDQPLPFLYEATNFEIRFRDERDPKPRALLQMATGSGKTFTAVTEVYRLAKFCKARRVLFLVDRGNLGRQALKEYQQYTVPQDGRKFTELYNAHILGTAGIGDEIKVTISTIQRMYSQLSGKELDEEVDEHSKAA